MKKKFTLLIAALALLTMIVQPGRAWGQTTETLNITSYATANSWVSGTAYTPISTAHVTITGLTNGNNSKYYSSNNSWRHYEGDNGTVTLSVSSDYTLSSVTFTYAAGNSGVLKDGTTNVTSGTEYALSGTTKTFSVGHSSGTKNGNVQIQNIVINIQSASSTTTPTSITIDASGITNTNVFVGTAAGSFSAAVTETASGDPVVGAAVTWTSSDEEVATIGETTGAVTLVAAGTTTITANYAGNSTYSSSSKTYSLTVINQDPNAPGTANNPYTVAEARTAIDAGSGTQGVYATGFVSAIVTPYGQGGYQNITFNIVDQSGDEVFLQAFRCVGDEAPNVAVNDSVVVFGNLTKYGSTYEFAQGCQVVSLTHPIVTVEAPTFNPEGGIYNEAQTVTITTATEGADIYYTLDGTEPTMNSAMYENPIVISSTTTIKAIAVDGDENTSSVSSATYTILSVANISSITEVGTSYMVRGTVVATNNKGFVMGDGTGYVYYYKNGSVTQLVGDMVTVSGTTGTYGQIIQFTNSATVTEATTSNYDNTPAAAEITTVPDYTQGYHLSTYFEFEGALAKSGSNYLITLGESQIQISYPTTEQGTALTALDGKTVHVKGYFTGINSNSKFTVMLESAEEVTTPALATEDVDIAYNAVEGVITYTLENPAQDGVLTAAITDGNEGNWLTLGTVGANVPFTCTANTGAERTATVTLTYTYNNATETKTATAVVTQAAYVAPVASITVNPASVNVSSDGVEGAITVTYENITTVVADVWFCNAAGTAAATYDWITASINTNNNVAYLVEPNDGEARTAYFKVSALDDATNIVYSNLVTINQAAPVTPGSWVLTDLADLTENDIFVIVGDNGDDHYYALPNDGGTSAPSVVEMTVANATLSGTIADNLQWNVSGDATDGYTFYPNGDDESWLYCSTTNATGSNNNIRVGTGDRKYFVLNDNNYLVTNDDYADRYLSIYLNSGTPQDWRGYVNTDNNAVPISFYKKVTGPVPTEPSITLDSYSIESTAAGLEGSLEVTYANYENPDDIEAEVWFCDANGETAVEYDWIIAAIDDKDVNNLYYIIDANTGDARTAYFKVLESSEGISSDLVTVTQEAYVAPTGTITVAPALVEATAAETEGNLAMTLENIVITEEGDGEFDLIFCDENGESLTDKPNWFAFDFPFENNAWSVSYSIEENTETAAREAYFKVYGLGDDGETEAYSNLVHVTQAGVVQTYLVSFELDGGTFVPNDDFTADIVEKEAGTYTLPSATKANINFAGWLLDGTETVYAAGAQYEVSDDVSFTAQWTNAITATITFGSAQGSTNINNISITGDDSNGNTWTITTVGTTSFTPNAGYAQIGSSNKPATSITFTTTLPNDVTITAFEAKFGGFSGTAGIIALKVGETTVGSGSLNATTDVTVNNTSTEFGNVLTVSVTGIAKGVKAYYISYSYETGTDPIINAPATVNLSSTDTEGEFEYSIVNPATGVNLEATTTTEWISNITVTDDKVTFNTTANTSETDDREGTITLSYTGAENKTVTVIQSKVDYASLPFEFTGGYADIASTNGLTEDEIDPNDYSGVTTKLKFNTTGDWLVLKLDASPTSLSYDIKGNTFSGGTFDVLTSADGVTYENLATYTQLGATQTVTHVDLASTVRYIKWIYTNKSSGNVGLGNIRATENYDIYGNATADHLNIPMDKVCTVYSGATLNIGVNGLSNEGNATNLIIKDGGQLYTPTAVSGTVEKNITGYGASTNSGYYLVSAPAGKYVYVAANNTNVDVYHFNAYYQGEEWRNFKTATGAWNITPENAALYASKNDTTLVFNGVSINYISGNPTVVNNDLPATNADISVPVSFNSGKAFQGLNLIGNPFTCKAYLSDGRDFYRMNAAGDGFILDTETNGGGHAINVCEGIFVVTTASETNVTFTTTDPTVANAGNNNSMINISLNQVVNRGEQALVDNARVRFGEGNAMRKFSFNDNTAKVYFTEGDQEYAVVRSEGQGEMPVNFKAAENGTYTISVDVENTEMAYLHLIDNKTGMDVDLLQTPSYTFEARTIDYASRFKLVFNANLGNADLGDDFGFISNGNLLILGIEGEATLQVMDITGRILSSETFSGSYNKALNTKAGVYMLRLIQGNETRTQKIVVK